MARAAAGGPRSDGGGDFHLADHAYAVVLRSIARCELPPGAWLNEREASAQLGMSRTPFRQALHRLELDGLIEIVPRRGARVALLDIDDVEDSLEVRQALETSLVRRVLVNGLPIAIDRLQELVRIMRRSIKTRDPASFLEADEQFHLTIAAAARNGRAMDALTQAWVHVNRARYLQPPSATEMRGSVRQHAEILDALRRRQPADAERAMVGHTQSARQLFGDLLTRFPHAFAESASDVGVGDDAAIVGDG